MATKAKRLPSGSWRVRVQIQGSDGARHYKSITAATKKEAERQAAEYEFFHKQKSPTALTVGEAIERYIDMQTAVLSPSTQISYTQIRRTRFAGIMPVRLQDLTSEAVQRAVNADAAHLSAKTVRNAYGLLTAALHVFAPGLMLRVNLPPLRAQEIEIPTEKQVQQLLQAAKGLPIYPAVLLGAYGGLRRSEICALTVQDLDRRAGLVRVNKALIVKDGRPIIKATKSRAGTRSVPLPDFVFAEIAAQLHPGQERVCPCAPNTITHGFEALCAQTGIRARFHDLRHVAASVLCSLNIPERYAMEIMGHSTPNMLRRVYGHLMDTTRQQVRDTIIGYYSSDDQPPTR